MLCIVLLVGVDCKMKMRADCWDCKKLFDFDELKFVEYKNTFVPKCKNCLEKVKNENKKEMSIL